jgi:acyl-CoA reductase-like NAD-dependent aldehyde dehydrogenase
MELGGKSPALVLPGADLKIAANNVSFPLTHTWDIQTDSRSFLALS